MAITYFAKVKGVPEVKARVYLFCQVFHKQVKKERVGVRV